MVYFLTLLADEDLAGLPRPRPLVEPLLLRGYGTYSKSVKSSSKISRSSSVVTVGSGSGGELLSAADSSVVLAVTKTCFRLLDPEFEAKC